MDINKSRTIRKFYKYFENKVDWNWIVKCQNLSEQFIRETNNKRELAGNQFLVIKKHRKFYRGIYRKNKLGFNIKNTKIVNIYIKKYKEFINFELLAINGQNRSIYLINY